MAVSAKQWIVRFALTGTRAIVRFSPSGALARFLLRTVFVKYLSWRPVDTIVSTRYGFRMRVRFPDLLQVFVYLFGIWEPAISRFVVSRLMPGDLFVDLGANVGYYSLLAATRVGPEGQVIAIEPSPDSAAALEENVLLNRFTNVHLIRAAVAGCRKTVPFFRGAPRNLGRSTIMPEVAARSRYGVERHVEAYALGELIAFDKLRHARLIKIDVEGAEAEIFEGIRHLLPHFSDRTEWIFEMNPGSTPDQGRQPEDIIRMFRDSGYQLYSVENSYQMDSYTRPPRPILERLIAVPIAQVDIVATRIDSGDHIRF